MTHLVLLYGNEIYYADMPYTDSVIEIGSGKKCGIIVPSIPKDEPIKVSATPTGIKVKCRQLEKGSGQFAFGEFCVIDPVNSIAMMTFRQSKPCTQTLKLPYNGVVRFGRKANSDNDVVFENRLVSSRHFVIRCEKGVAHVEDLGSTNGLFLNGKKIQKAVLRAGDVLSIWQIKMRFANGELSFENVSDGITINTVADEKEKSVRNPDGKTNTFSRSPRTRTQMPSEPIILAQPPSKPQKHQKGNGLFSSIAGSSAMLVSTVAMGVTSPAMLAARAAGFISPVTNIVNQQGNTKKRKKSIEEYTKERAEKYGIYIEGQRAKINAVAEIQQKILSSENPAPKECMETVRALKRNVWERRFTDNDFLDVRIGNSYEKLCVEVRSFANGNAFEMESDEIRSLAEYIIEETRYVDNVPARLRMRQENTVGLVGERNSIVRLVKNILVSLTAEHCYEDVQIVGLFGREEYGVWESLRWLPHIWDENKQMRYLAFGKDDAHRLCELFHDVLRSRKNASHDSYKKEPYPKPHYVFIVGNPELIKGEPLADDLLENLPAMSATALYLYEDISLLPPECEYIIDVGDGSQPNSYDCSDASNRIMFTMDEEISSRDFDMYARNLSSIELKDTGGSSGLPNSLTFLQGYGVSTVKQLNIEKRWEEIGKSTLAVPIGVTATGNPFLFDIVSQGPHGLVAGTTGSGKSELLQSWILSVCVNFHPYEVNFVIIDYKGGGMANMLEGLPHTVGKITNIGSNINRSMESLNSELKRRQILLDNAGVNKISKYQEMYRNGKVKEPMPRLIIVSDEFAELKKQEPDFMATLISAARIGRSLGVHLVLATQKPGGVVDEQINSNASFRICLKVQNASDSREMLSRPDAAKITSPGRAYVRVGEDDVYEQIQSYWSGAPYLGACSKDEDIGNQSRIVEISGNRIKTVADEKTRFKSDTDELKAISTYMCRLMDEMGLKKLPGPWLPDLEETVYPNDISCVGGFNGSTWEPREKEWLSIPVGRYDSPALQSQGDQFINLAEDGHYGIYGAPTTGKTTMLKTIVSAVCKYYTPEEVNIYVLDFGGWNMAPVKKYPHVGDVVLDYEAEKFAKLMGMISAEFDRRKKAFVSNMVTSLSTYRKSVAKDIPALILMVDNIVPMFDQYPDNEEMFYQIGREGATYGIYLIYTANSTNGVRFKLTQNIRSAIAFELTDKCDYASIVGKIGSSALPPITGRAFIKAKPPIMFQAALFAEGEDDISRARSAGELAEKMSAVWTGKRPKPLPVMPEAVGIGDIEEQFTSRSNIMLGIAYDNISAAGLNLYTEYGMIVSGGVGSGKSKLLCAIAGMIRRRFSDSEIYVFDSTRKSMSSAGSAADSYAVVNENDRISYMLAEIVDKLNKRKREQNRLRAEQGEAFSEKEYADSLPGLYIFIDDICDFVDTVDDNNAKSMERIARLAQGLAVYIIAAGRVSGLSRYSEVEPITRAIIANQKGIAISDSASMHTYFKNNLNYSEKDAVFGEGNAMLFDNAFCRKIKLMDCR